MRRGILLYGPPAVGKDTITGRLSQLNGIYQQFERLKYGRGRTSGYRMICACQLEAIHSDPNEVLWENHRYGSTYIVDRSPLLAMVGVNKVPVVHLGQAEAVMVLTKSVPEIDWLVVDLWCPRYVAAERLACRSTGDTDARLEVFESTVRLPNADITIDTSRTSPYEAAARIDRQTNLTNSVD